MASTPTISNSNKSFTWIDNLTNAKIIKIRLTTGAKDIVGNSIVSQYTQSNGFSVESYLPDSGQTDNYTNTFGEDNDYTINPLSFKDNGDGTISDETTLLMWQQEDDGTKRNWSNAGSYCSSLNLVGQNDWRLPETIELISILDYGRTAPPIDSTIFTNTKTADYWAARLISSNNNAAWHVSGYGNVRGNTITSTAYVRCVRGTYPTFSLTDNGDMTINQEKTGMIWQKADSVTNKNWEAALNYCEGLSLASKNDWRLPNIKELFSIVDNSTSAPAINSTYFQNNGSFYLSSTTNVYTTSGAQVLQKAWGVTFGNYGDFNDVYKTGYNYVRCVRSD